MAATSKVVRTPETRYLSEILRAQEHDRDAAWYVPARVRVKSRIVDGITFLLRWADDSSSAHLLLLGDYGAGKSYLCRRFVYELSKRRLKHPDAPLPLLFSLSEIRRHGSLKAYLRARIMGLGVLLPGEGWRDVLDRTRQVVILDELDEVPELRGVGDIDSIFREISALSLTRSRLLLAARSHVFGRVDKIWGAKMVRASSTSRTGFYQIVELLDFTEKQQSRYLLKRFGTRAAQVARTIARSYGLHEFAGRPLLLRMIADTAAVKGGTETLEADLATLYSKYIAKLLLRRERQTGIPADELRRWCHLISVELFHRGQFWIDSAELLRLGRNTAPADLAALSTAAPRGAPADLLLHRKENRFRFSHLSLFHFFLAEAFLQDLAIGRADILSAGPLAPETLHFALRLRPRIQWQRLIRRGLQRRGKRRWRMINILKLSLLARPQYLKTILPPALRSKEPELIQVALKCAGYGPPLEHSARELVARLGPSKRADIAYLAIEAVGLQRLSGASPLVIQSAGSKDPELRRISLWALRKLRTPDTVPIALRLLKSRRPRALRSAAEILGMRQESRAADQIADRLRLGGLSDWDRYYLHEALLAISSRRRQDWTATSTYLLRDQAAWRRALLASRTSPWVRRYLVEQLGEHRLAASGPVLRKIYPAANRYLRNSIIDALGELRLASNVRFLEEAFVTEHSPRIRANILWALGNTAHPRSLGVILAALSDKNAEVREWAQWARAQYGHDPQDVRSARYIYP